MSNYLDLNGRVPEDERIRRIGEYVMSPAFAGKKALVATDDEEGKPERYRRKLLERYPGIAAGEIVKGPTPGACSFSVWQIQKGLGYDLG